MGTTYLKRQKEMKRLEKQREKAERRAQKKIANRAQNTHPVENLSSTSNEAEGAGIPVPLEDSADPDNTPLK